MVPSFQRFAELYQRYLVGIKTYEELGARILRHIRTAYSFRRVEEVRELSRILLNIPIKEYRLIAEYYLVWCQCREFKFHDRFLESIIEQSQTYKSKASISRAAFDVYRGHFESALSFYKESLRANPTLSDYIVASRGVATIKSAEGFHAGALTDLDCLIPLLRYAEPLTHYEVINSYAVELIEAGLVAVSSPFAPFYPEWQQTFAEIRSRQKQRSTIAFSRVETGHANEVSASPGHCTESETPENPIDTARAQAVIDFMKANLHRRLTRKQLAEVVNVSPSHFSHFFKAQMGIPPIDYLIRLRMQKAGQLLATTFLSVKQIMYEVGDNSRDNFLRHFKKTLWHHTHQIQKAKSDTAGEC
jgi:AraC-like DNA-binding protein